MSWDKCACPWLGRFRSERRINLAKWAGLPGPLTRSIAGDVLRKMQGQILNSSFHHSSRNLANQGDGISFGKALEQYREARPHRGKAYQMYFNHYKTQFGDRPLNALATGGTADFEKWLLDQQESKGWSKVNTHRWFEYGNAFFNWALRKKKWVKENPFMQIDGFGSGKGQETRHSYHADAGAGPATGSSHERLADAAGQGDWGDRPGNPSRRDAPNAEQAHPLREVGDQRADLRIQFRCSEQRRFLGPEAYVFGSEEGKRDAAGNEGGRTAEGL